MTDPTRAATLHAIIRQLMIDYPDLFIDFAPAPTWKNADFVHRLARSRYRTTKPSPKTYHFERNRWVYRQTP